MNIKKLAPVALTAALALGLSALAEEKKEAEKKQTTCPVMGGKIIKANYADVNGKRIYVCCLPCADKVKADPDKYIKQLESEGVILEKVPTKNEHKKHDQSERDHSGHNH